MRFNKPTLKTCPGALCLLLILSAVGSPQGNGATFFMKEIKLTQGKVALVDDADFAWLNQWKWFAHRSIRGYYYASRQIRNNKGTQTTMKMHRVILNVKDSRIFVDHKDHDTLNNQRNNLRKCSSAQNTQNSMPRLNCTSKYIGVSLLSSKGPIKKWVAFVGIKGEQIYIGCFDSEIEAAKARDKEAKKYHKEFVRLNF